LPALPRGDKHPSAFSEYTPGWRMENLSGIKNMNKPSPLTYPAFKIE